ncbi:MAG: YebC/PmpR family DNA-binding transcriptional regulator [bacterium]|nr:YebC/PmpR family DNA-binding transcriptional regulator [bacterium]
MSGHSKWHSIKHKKAATDAKRGQSFTKLANIISAAARTGGGDPNANLRLKIAIESARKDNLPKENIERAIKRGTGELGGAIIEEFTIEAFASGNIGLLIEVITDNRNRTLAEVRNIISKAGGRVADNGSVAHLFEQKGVIRAALDTLTAEQEEAVIDSGALDYDLTDGTLTITATRNDLNVVKTAVEAVNINPETAQLEFVASVPLPIEAEIETKLLNLLETLDNNDDVANVSTNAEGI